MDLLLLDPIYGTQGIPALLTHANGGIIGNATIINRSFGTTLSRKARRFPGVKRNKGRISQLSLQTSRPYAAIRSAELLTLAGSPGELVKTIIRFNDEVYRVESYMYRPNPSGLDESEVLLILAEADLSTLVVLCHGQIDGDSECLAKLAAWLRANCVGTSNCAAILAAFLRGEVDGDCSMSALIKAYLSGTAQCLSELNAKLAAWLVGEIIEGESDLTGTLPAWLTGLVDGDCSMSALIKAYLDGSLSGEGDLEARIAAWLAGEVNGEADCLGTLPAWLVGQVDGVGTLEGTITSIPANARIVVDGTLRMTADGQIRVTV